MRAQQQLSRMRVARRKRPAGGDGFGDHRMTCPNCARHVNRGLQERARRPQPRQVRLRSHRASCAGRRALNRAGSAVIQAVEEDGLRGSVAETQAPEPGAQTSGRWQLNLWVGIFGTRR